MSVTREEKRYFFQNSTIGKTIHKDKTRRNEILFDENSLIGSEFLENEKVDLIIGEEEKIMEASVSFSKFGEKEKHFQIGVSVKFGKEIGNQDICIRKKKKAVVKCCKIAGAEEVRESKLRIPTEIYDSLMIEGIEGLKVVNHFNGYSLFFPKDKIVREEKGEQDYVRLNAKQRLFLDLDLPMVIEPFYYDRLEEFDGRDIKQNYEKDSSGSHYKWKETLETKGCKLEKISIGIYPISDWKKGRKIWNRFKKAPKRIRNFLLNRLMNDKKVVMRVIRPYLLDESENIVRISNESMKNLGISEGDILIIKKYDREIKARVFLMEFEEAKKNTLIKDTQEMNLLIGISSFSRNELDLPYINESVFVKRDNVHLFKKNLNNQVFTIIGLLLSMNFLYSLENIWLQIALGVMIVFVFIYLSFSELREKL